MRRFSVLLAALPLAAAALVFGPAAQPAFALTPGVGFSAEDLPTWQADGVVYALGQTGGRVYAGGTFTQIRPPAGDPTPPQDRSAFAVFNAETGSPDPNCQLDVTLLGGTPTVRSIVASPDGSTVYLGGNFSNVGGTTVSRVAAIDTATCTVKPFAVNGISSFVYSLALSGNTLYLAGAFNNVADQPRQQFAAVDATTGALLPFTANSALVNRAADDAPDGRALAVSPDGTKVALGGEFDTINGSDSHSFAVVDGVTGAVLRAYPGFIHPNSVTKTLVSDGQTVYAGNEGTGSGVFDGRFAVDWGTLNQKWRDTCLGATQSLALYQGTLYAAAHSHNCASMNEFQDGSRNYFIAESTDAGVIKQWNPKGSDGIGEGIGPRALSVVPGPTTGKTYLWAGGEFTKINGHDQQSLTRFGPDDSGAPPVPNVAVEALTSNAVQVRFRTVVDPDDGTLTYRIYRNGSATPIQTIAAQSLWWTRPQVTWVDNTVTSGTTYSYRVTASDGTNTSDLSTSVSAKAATKAVDYPTQVINDGASLFWRYDEAAAATWIQDKSGPTTTGKNGLAVNGVTLGTTTGALTTSTSKAATFDGVDDYIWSDQYLAAPSTYSIETWIKTTTTTGGKIVGYGNGRPRTDTGDTVLSSTFDRQIYMDNTGRITFGVYTTAAQTIRSTAALNNGVWHHIVATQGPGGMALYVDGASVGTKSTTTAQQYFGVWHVGGDSFSTAWPNTPTSRMFKGAIDETAIYPRALTTAQVSKHYSLGGGTTR